MKTHLKLAAFVITGMVAAVVAFPALVRTKPGAGTNGSAVAKVPLAPQGDASAVAPARMILVPHQGDAPLDRRIISAQQAVAAGKTPEASIENLGWLFIEKARISYDPGFFKLAEQCALCLEGRKPGSPAAMLLRGHVLQNLHQFKQAEPLARQLVAKRGAPFDYGLLGDVLADLGQLDGAIAAYQSMMDLRPDSQALARVAHVRWMKGDVSGAVEAMREAARIVSLRNAGSAAWMNARLAFFQFQAGNTAGAEASCAAALDCVANFPPALVVRGRMQLAVGQSAAAVETLRRAVAGNPLPEHEWLLSEALRASGQESEATTTEARLIARGVADDPRTVSLFLSTHGQQLALALSLAEKELETRADVFTHDAVAWALAANGRNDDAWKSIGHALAEGTKDARTFLHAGVIAANLGRGDASEWLTRARQLDRLLLPSERRDLDDAEKRLAGTGTTFTARH